MSKLIRETHTQNTEQEVNKAEEILKSIPHINEAYKLIDDPIVTEITSVIKKFIRIIEDMAEWKSQPLLESLICRDEIEYKYLESFRRYRRAAEEISLKRYLDKTEAELNVLFDSRNEGKKKTQIREEIKQLYKHLKPIVRLCQVITGIVSLIMFIISL